MISIEKLSKAILVSGYARKLCRIIPVIVALALFGVVGDTYAQQKDDLVRVHGIPISIKAAAKTDDKKDDKKKDDSPLSEREKTLLDRIEQLEKRLAESSRAWMINHPARNLSRPSQAPRAQFGRRRLRP